MAVTGPASYANFCAYDQGAPLRYLVEVPLFSDAQFVDEVRQGMGPVVLLNMLRNPFEEMAPAIMLRCAIHEDFGTRELLATKDLSRFTGASHFDEIACLLSLEHGARIVAGEPTRIFDGEDPLGTPRADRSRMPMSPPRRAQAKILPWATEPKTLAKGLLGRLHALSASEALALARAARSYRDAILVAESDPELAWLLLVSAVEVLAVHQARPNDESASDRLRSVAPQLVDQLEAIGPGVVDASAPHLNPLFKATARFLSFFESFPPSPPERRPPEGFQFRPWGDLRRALATVYEWRSRALHDAIPFPPPMCLPPTAGGDWDAPCETVPGLSAIIQGGYWSRKQTPFPLHFFAHLARSSMMCWWERRSG